jgi:hypothetical protein
MYSKLNRAGSSATRRYNDRFVGLQTEAAVLPTDIRHTHDPTRLAGCVTDTHFEGMDAERLLAEVSFHFLDDQASLLQIFLIGEHEKAVPNKKTHSDEQTEPGSLGEHVKLLSGGVLEPASANQIAES